MFCITGTHTHCHTSNGLLLAALQYYDSYAACGDLFHQLLSLPLFWHGWTTVIMLLWQACQTTYSAVFSHSSTLQLGRPLVFLAEVTPQVVASFHWAHQVQTGSPHQPSSARHSTPVSVWRTVLYRWYAGERSWSSTSSLLDVRRATVADIQLPLLHVPGFGTVFLVMSCLPHLS